MLNWSPHYPPDGDFSFYDHVFAETPLGMIKIEWKSWKDHDSYDCTLPWGKHVSEDSFEYAKIRVEEEFAILAASLQYTPVMRHKIRWAIQKRCRDAFKEYDKVVEEWADFEPCERGGSPMEAVEEAFGDAEVQLLDSILDCLRDDFGFVFSQ